MIADNRKASEREHITKLPVIGSRLRALHRTVVYTPWLDALSNRAAALEYEVGGLRDQLAEVTSAMHSADAKPAPPEDEIRLQKALARLAVRESPWFPIHLQEPDEAYVQANVEHHAAFVATIGEYAALAAGTRTARLVEVGCGAGTMAIALSREHYSVHAIDLDPLLIAKAQRLQVQVGGFVRFMAMDVAELALWKEASFDVAFSQGTLEHFHPDDVGRALHLQLDVARYSVLSVPSVDWPSREFGNERKLGIEAWTSLFEAAGLTIEKISYYGNERSHLQAVVSRPTP